MPISAHALGQPSRRLTRQIAGSRHYFYGRPSWYMACPSASRVVSIQPIARNRARQRRPPAFRIGIMPTSKCGLFRRRAAIAAKSHRQRGGRPYRRKVSQGIQFIACMYQNVLLAARGAFKTRSETSACADTRSSISAK